MAELKVVRGTTVSSKFPSIENGQLLFCTDPEKKNIFLDVNENSRISLLGRFPSENEDFISVKDKAAISSVINSNEIIIENIEQGSLEKKSDFFVYTVNATPLSVKDTIIIDLNLNESLGDIQKRIENYNKILFARLENNSNITVLKIFCSKELDTAPSISLKIKKIL